MGHPRALGALVFSDVRAATRWLPPTSSSSWAQESLERCWRHHAGAASLVHEHDARAQRGRRGHDVFTLLARFAQQRLAAVNWLRTRAGQVREPAPQHPAPLDRRAAEGPDAADRRSLQHRLDPLRRRGRLHAVVGVPPAGRGRRHPRPALLLLRHPCRAVRTREDQDDRRLLHGGRRRADTVARSRTGPGVDGAGHRRRDARRRRRRALGAATARGDQLGTGRGRRDRSKTLPLRPVGRRRQHRQPDGIARDDGADPDHSGHLRTARRRVPLRAEGHDRRQGQGRDGSVVLVGVGWADPYLRPARSAASTPPESQARTLRA